MDLGLYDYNARYDVPGIGRFASADTLVPDPANPQSFNRYSYTHNNPVRYTDPSGHCIFGVDTAVCIAAGAALLKAVDWGWSAWDMWQSGRVLNSNRADRGEKVMAALNIGMSVLFEVVEPDDLLPISLPLDDVARKIFLRGAGEALEEGGEAGLRSYIRNQLGDHADAVINKVDELVDNFNMPNCAFNSFQAGTEVMTEEGPKPIEEIQEGDRVLAYNEATGEIGYYPVTDLISHVDRQVVYLTIAGETLATTADHPFYTAAGDWIVAGDLAIGDTIRTATGTTGQVEAIYFVTQPQPMYNFTVATAHTYFVGDGQWLVHSECWAHKIANGHAFDDHLDDFMAYGIESRDEFAEFLTEVETLGEMKDLGNGRFAYWLDDGYGDGWGTVMIVDPNNIDGGTAVRRADAWEYFDSLD